MANLQSLNCCFNQLQTLPFCFADLRDKLQYFNHSENPFTEMPEIKEMSLGKLMHYLDEKRGRKPHKALWKVSEELCRTLRKYLLDFGDFVFKLSGNKIVWDVNLKPEVLELVVEPRELSMSEIDGFLSLYVGNKLEIDFEALTNKFSATELLQLKWFIKDLEFEKQILRQKLETEIDKVEFFKKENHKLTIEISFFQDQRIERCKRGYSQTF